MNKTLEITREHFEALYPSAKGYEFFQYDSAKLGQVRNYATSPNIQIMVITVGAINKFGDETEAAVEESDESKRREKSKNVMYRASEKTGGEKPIDPVSYTHLDVYKRQRVLCSRSRSRRFLKSPCARSRTIWRSSPTNWLTMAMRW